MQQFDWVELEKHRLAIWALVADPKIADVLVDKAKGLASQTPHPNHAMTIEMLGIFQAILSVGGTPEQCLSLDLEQMRGLLLRTALLGLKGIREFVEREA